MGKGDKKTKRGKITIGSYGVRRPKKEKKYVAPEPVKELKKKTVLKEEVVVENAIPMEEKPKKVKKALAPKEKATEEKPKAKKTTKKAKE
jgi:30S ribosomal protein S31